MTPALAARRAASLLVFPSLFVAEIGAAMALLARGVAPAVVVGASFAVTVPLVALLERTLPFRREWNRARGDLGADLVYLPMTMVIDGALQPALRLLALAVAASLAPLLGGALWPGHWPLGAQFLLACAVGEFFDYFAHRVMHERPWLWRLHATHHSAPRLYWLNAARAHPGEMAFRGAVAILPLALLGAGNDVFALLGVVNIVVGFFQHANVELVLGPLSWVFSIGDVHRWHHARPRRDADCNYGNNFLFWDVVFGTRRLPADRPPPDAVGIEGLDAFPRGPWAQIAAPWRWQAIVARSAGRRPGPPG